ncbi:hypothetical protein [Paramuribaculum intestinale]|uniref:hypothetical protein n=1 Tax=Paramuribaculum intestinale TaxID=2094151 RepID=UPI0025A65F4B|nr:hypothetical protein [Paramuribaculum intestinale]
MNIFRIILLAAVIMMAAACKRNAELLDSIPADADAVARIDIRRLARECGDALPHDISDRIHRLETAVDLSEVFLVVDAGGRDVWLTATVINSDSLTAALGQPSDKDADGFVSYAGGTTLPEAYARDGRIWVAVDRQSSATPAAMVRKATASGGEGSMAKVPGTGDFLRRPMMAGIAVAGNGFTDQWQCIEMQIHDNALVFDHFRVDQRGMVAPTAGLEPVNTRFLDYAPHPASMAFAAGIDKDNVDWDGIGKAIGMIGGFTYYGFYESILPFLKEIDGTISIVASQPTDGHPGSVDISTTRFIIMAHMGQESARRAIATAETYIVRLGLPVDKAADGSLALRYGSIHLHAAYIDGYLTISNFVPHKSEPSPQLVDAMKGHLATGLLDIDRATVRRWLHTADYGVSIKAEAGNTHNTVTLRLTGCGDTPILQALIKTFVHTNND